jgi:WD40 repeat protein
MESNLGGASVSISGTALELKQVIQIQNLTAGISPTIQTVAAYSKGFLVAGNAGFLSVYEKSDDRKDPFFLVKSFSAGADEILSSMAVAPSDEMVVCYSKNRGLLSFPLGSVGMNEDLVPKFEDIVPHGVHVGGIVALDCCVQKPILITCGADKCARVWHYQQLKCMLVQRFSEEPTCCALHPSGMQVVIGFKERLRLYNVLMDGLRPFREMGLKHCKEVRYSNGGQYFAVAVGINVMIFPSYTFEPGAPLHQPFTGHIQPVRQLVWSPDDRSVFLFGRTLCFM